MALDVKLNISVSNKCDSLTITDTTGSFSPESNPGGWGVGSMTGNQTPYTEKYYAQITIIPNIIINEILYRPVLVYSSTEIGTTQGTWVFPTYSGTGSNTLEKFSLILSAAELYQDILNNSSISLENLNEEFIMDSIYTITFRLIDVTTGNALENISDAIAYEKAFCFTNVCILKKEVDKLFSSVNVECEDCDDRDIEEALLAQNLLKSLENSCNN